MARALPFGSGVTLARSGGTECSERRRIIKITIWLATRERDTWIMAAELLALTWVLLEGSGTALRFAALPILAHLGYRALTSMPIGAIPGRRAGFNRPRRNQLLRARVVAFLNEVQQADKYARQARAGQWPHSVIDEEMRTAEMRMMAAAAEVVKVMGRPV